MPAEQAREVVRRLSLRGLAKPFARCIRCNGNLNELPKAAARGLVPARTYQYIHRYLQCDACGKVYWKGTHWKHLQHIVNSALDIEASI